MNPSTRIPRRAFLTGLAGGAILLRPDAVRKLARVERTVEGMRPDEVAEQEDYWLGVRQAFTIDANQINLNSGSVSPAPRVVAEAMDRYWTMTNMSPSLYVDDLLYPEVDLVRRRLAGAFGCDPEELALTRNTTESLHAVIFGLELSRGDEVITTTQDYPSMLSAWRQRERRDGVVLKTVTYSTPPPSLDHLYDRIAGAITPRTKVIHICHMTYTAGQIFPVKRICQIARSRGIQTVVDGGHTFAQFPFTIADLDCDYYGTSLHKWLTAPVGNGFLYVRRERIASVWPLFGAPAELKDNIRKFETIGTYPISIRNAVTDALTFHQAIGFERKAARFQLLRQRWMKRVEGMKGVKLYTAWDPAQACALGTMGIAGVGANALTARLLARHRVHVRPRFVTNEWEGIRVTPNVFTTLEEIDAFTTGIADVVANGV